MHCDRCKEFIHANSPTFGLAKEFIESIDPDRDERAWQRFQSPEDILPDLQGWLGGGMETLPVASSQAPVLPGGPKVMPASRLPRAPSLQADAALKNARAWLAGDAVQAELGALPPAAAAEAALRRFYKELTGTEPQGAEGRPISK